MLCKVSRIDIFFAIDTYSSDTRDYSIPMIDLSKCKEVAAVLKL